jgi:hypothetical protein
VEYVAVFAVSYDEEEFDMMEKLLSPKGALLIGYGIGLIISVAVFWWYNR